MAFLNEKVILIIAGAWAGSSSGQCFCTFLWLHQMWPHTRCHQPYPNLNHSPQRTMSITQERKPKPSPVLQAQKNEYLCTFLQLGDSLKESLPFIFSGPYPISPLQFRFQFFFPSTSSSQAKACLSLSLSNLPHTQVPFSSFSSHTSQEQTEDWNWRGWVRRRGRTMGPLAFDFILFFCNFNQRFIIL